MRISMRAGEKLYLNGAVLSVDRRVSIDLLNDATFLLEAHVMQAADATTPLRQLYFVVQLMLMDPSNAAATRLAFDKMFAAEMAAFEDRTIRAALEDVRKSLDAERPFDALKELRSRFSSEDSILDPSRADSRNFAA